MTRFTVVLALGLVLGSTTHAHALPIGIAIAGAIGLGGLGIGTTIVGALIMGAIGVGAQLILGALMRKKGSADVGGTTGKMQTGGVVPRSFPFGAKAPVTHSLTYWNSFGQDGKTPNAYVAFEFALSDLPIGGGNYALQEIWVNGSQVTWHPEWGPETYGIVVPEFIRDDVRHMWVEVFDGTQTTADSFLVSQFSADPDWPYLSSRVGFGVVKVRIVCRLNRDLFSGYPSFKFVCKGVPFYDPREDSSVGGSGDQRWNTPEEWGEAPENPITVAYNVIRGISYDGEWFFGGQTASAAQLPFASWVAAQNECDVEIENEDESTELQFRCAGEIRLDMEPADVVDDLMRACNGQIGEIGGVYKPHVGPAGVAVLSITDDDIRTDEEQTYEPFFGLQDIVNSINAKYVEPGDGWTAKDAPALVDTDLEAEDGGRRQPVDLQYEYVPFGRQVQRQIRAALLDYRRERRHALPLAPEAWRLEPAIDFISWTSERNGYTSKLFSVETSTDMDGYLVGVAIKEVDPSDYDDVSSVPPTVTPNPLVDVPVQGINDVDIEGVVIQGAGERAKAGARLIWDGEDQDDVRAVAFQIRVDGETDPIYQGETSESAVAAGEYIVSANLSPATDYEGRLKFVPYSGRLTSWSDWIEFTTPDVRLSYDELAEKVQALDRLVAERFRSIDAKLDEVGGAVASIESVTTEQDLFLVERARRISASLGGAKASITETQIVQATVVNALAALGIDVEAALGTDSAAGFLRIIASVDGGGALAALLFGVSTTENGVTEGAAFKMIASGGQSLIQLVADQTQILDENGDPFATFDGTDATLYIDRIRRFTASQFQQLKSTDSTVRSISSGMSWLNIWSTTFDLEQDGDTLFLYSYNLTPVTGPGYICDIRVKVDGNVYEQRRLANFQQGFWFAEAMDAGSHSFDVEIGNCSSGSGTSSFHPQILLLPNSTK
jgi:hypothetical protein